MLLKTVAPITRWLPGYEAAWLRPDIVAGLTLAAFTIPVALAYASLAGLPSQVGLYCVMLGGLAYAVFGSSRQMAVGPTSSISILVASTLGALVAGDPARYAALAAATALMVAVASAVAWALRLGVIVNFIADTVLTGFKAGVALQIASTQLPKLFGISGGSGNFIPRILFLVRHLGETKAPALAVGLAGIVLLVVGGRLFPRRPVSLVVVVLSIVFASVTSLAARGVDVVGLIPQGLPALTLPAVSGADFDTLLSLALACFLLSYVESMAVARTFAAKHGYEIDPNQELLALGVTNAAVAFGHGYPVGGGMSQSAVNDASGARTPAALLVAVALIVAVLVFLTGLFRNLPSPILAAVVLVAAAGLIDLGALGRMRRASPAEFRIALLAAISVLVLGMLRGLFVGVIASVVMLIARAAHPPTAILGRVPGTDNFTDLAHAPHNEEIPDVLVFRVDGAIFFANAASVRNAATAAVERAGRPIKLVVFTLEGASQVDLAAVAMLEDLHDRLGTSGISLRLVHARYPVRRLILAAAPADRFGTLEPTTTIAGAVEAWRTEG